MAGWVALHGSSMLIKDVTKSKRFQKLESKVSDQIKSILCMPIQGEEEVIGVINMSHPDIGAFSRENERALTLITHQAALAFNNLYLLERIKSFNERLEHVVAERTRELRYSESKYRSFMEQAGDAIVVAERGGEGRIIEVNDRACAFTGLMREELAGKPLASLVEPASQKELKELLHGGEGARSDIRVRRHSGASLYADISANTIVTPGGEVTHLIIRDVTLRKELEAKLKEYSERLEELVEQRTRELRKAQGELVLASKMAAVGELASGVAHEINNPLAVISGYAEDLLDKLRKKLPLEPDEVAEALAMITRQSDRCQEITNSLLNFTRTEELRLALVDVSYVVLQAIHFATHRAKRREIEFQTDFDKSLPHITSDASMIEQVLLNLYNNAIDAIEATGKVVTSTRLEGPNVIISVRDTGSGIPRELQDKIFNPFFTTKPVGKGTGLGLSICHKLVERLHGQIAVSSEVGVGTEFTIALPASLM
ncbi:MAG: PAS domain S-box protein [Nitrospinae bacterium]|nr:PAS domain S-box protein [Nitrospinota bacterium]